MLDRLLRLMVVVGCLAAGWCANAADKPNVVIILCDDLGYGDVRVNNPASKVPTPSLDALANGGMRFTDAHTPSAVCTPTRYGLLTGRYCWRTRLTRGVLNGYSEHLIEPDRMTIADLMKNAGYHTACIGKWHLGMDLPKPPDGKGWDFAGKITNGPNACGFDYFFGVTASLDMPPYVFVENDGFSAPVIQRIEARPFPSYWRGGEIAEGFDHRAALDDLTDKATGYIAEQAKQDKPFFLYFPLTAPHKPTLPAERFTGKSGIGPYGDFVMQVDDVVGRVDKALKDVGVFDNTLVIVTSDNGSYMYRYDDDRNDHTDDDAIQGYRAATHTANGGWRGTKADIHEGGHRVFFALRWPGHVLEGSVDAVTISLVDVFATLASITGQELPDDAAEDSFSLMPVLAHAPLNKRAPVILHSANGTFAIRDGRWKLIAGSGSGGRGQPKSQPFDKPYQLYDMVKDPSETTNLIEQHPDIAAELEAKLKQIRESGRSR